MAIYVIKTTDGAPMNETAACDLHLDEYSDDGYALALDADDAPASPEYVEVSAEFAGNNDTVCNVCAALEYIKNEQES